MRCKPDLDEINKIIGGLPQAALSLTPNDRPLRFLTSHVPIPVTEANAQLSIDVLGLICRRLAVGFNALADEYEKMDLTSGD